MKGFCLLVCAFLSVSFQSGFSQAAVPQSGGGEDVIEFSGGKMSGSMKENQDYAKLSDNARIKTSSIEVAADTIELYGEDFRYIRAEGAVRGNQEKEGLAFSCSSMEYDREERIAVFSGNVLLEDKENQVVAKAQRIEYREEEAVALLQVDVELTKDDSLSTCAFALYRKNEKMLEMTGNPQVKQGNDTFRAQEIVFNLDTDEITLDGRVRGKVTETGGAKE